MSQYRGKLTALERYRFNTDPSARVHSSSRSESRSLILMPGMSDR